VEDGPRLGTRVERAGEGCCEGEEGLRDLTGLIVTSASHNIRVDLDAGRERIAEDLSGLRDGIAEEGLESLC
jgi:hypothetical protein